MAGFSGKRAPEQVQRGRQQPSPEAGHARGGSVRSSVLGKLRCGFQGSEVLTFVQISQLPREEFTAAGVGDKSRNGGRMS